MDEHFRTNVKHIYAVGDVIGFPALASISAEQGRIAAGHACGDPTVDGMPAHLPDRHLHHSRGRGRSGDTKGELKGKGIEYIVGRAEYAQTARGEIIGERTGFLKLLFAKDGLRLLGAHAIGEQATELVHLGLMALQTGGNADCFWRTCFNYPTLGDLYKLAAHDALLKRG